MKTSRTLCALCLSVEALLSLSGRRAEAQQTVDSRRALLKPYEKEFRVTFLDWGLVQINLAWNRMYTGEGSYLESHPIGFNSSEQRFFHVFIVNEYRSPSEREFFSSLPEYRKRAILQKGVDDLISLLATSFSEVAANRSLVQVEFWHNEPAGGTATIAAYKNGELKFSP